MDAREARKAPPPFSLARGLAKYPFHSAARAGHSSACLTCSNELHSPLCNLPCGGVGAKTSSFGVSAKSLTKMPKIIK